MLMKCLILGGSGLLGHRLVISLVDEHEVSFTYFNNPIPVQNAIASKLDLKDLDATVALIDKFGPDAVLHAVAPPSVDWHEKERAAAYQTNVLGTCAIADKTRELGVKLAYVSTAFVFPDVDKVFTEDDIPAPINFYGVTKLGAELAAMRNPDHLIVRTDQIYGWALPGQKKSFVVNVLEKTGRGERVEVCQDWYNCPTYVGDLSDAIISLVEKGKRGIFHTVGSSFINRYDWAVMIARAFGGDPGLVVPINSASLNLPARRPNVRIDNAKIQDECGFKMKSVEEGIEAMKEEQKS